MKECEIKEGDIVEIDYIDDLTKERISEGKALVLWKGFNRQPLIRKSGAKRTTWSGYDHIARVISHVDIEKYMDDFMENAIALEQEPRWIPVSERLPKAQTSGADDDCSDWVQVTLHVGEDNDVVCRAYYCFSDKEWYTDTFVLGEVTAWMPLPEPYNADREVSE